MKKITLKGLLKNSYVIIGFLFLLLIILTVTIVLPVFNKTLETYNGLGSKQSRLDKLIGKAAELEGLNEKELFDREVLSSQALPSEKNIVFLMRTISNVSMNSGIFTGGLTLKPGSVATPSGDSLQKLKFEVTVSGGLDKSIAFAKSIEETMPLINITSVDIGSEGVFKLETFFYSPKPRTYKVDAAVPKMSKEEISSLDKLANFIYASPPVFIEFSKGGKENPFFQ